MSIEPHVPTRLPPHRRLVARAIGLMIRPDAAWREIEAEPQSVGGLTKSYILPMAAIPAASIAVGFLILAEDQADMYSGMAFTFGALMFLQSVLLVFGLALLIRYILAQVTDVRASYVACLTAAAYSMTPVWILGFALIAFPTRIFLVRLIGFLWASYVFYVGSPRIFGVPASKVFIFTLASMGAALVADSISSKIVGLLTGH